MAVDLLLQRYQLHIGAGPRCICDNNGLDSAAIGTKRDHIDIGDSSEDVTLGG